jgi:hypothetical protein
MEKLTKREVFELSLDAYYKRSSNPDFSADERENGFKEYLADLNKDFRRNKEEIFEILEETANEILPKKVRDTVQQFAEFRQFGNNDTVEFVVRRGKIKAVNVAIGGTVKRFRVDSGRFTISTEAVQTKVYEYYERVISGMVDWNQHVNMVVDAINEAVMKKIYQCLLDLYSKLPEVNVHSASTFETAEFDKILNVVKAYGTPVIMGTPVAIGKIPFSSPTNPTEIDKMDIRNRGAVGVYKGCNVVELTQSFEDNDNLVPVFNDNYIFIIPSGQEKVIKVAMQGGLITRENSQSPDWTWNYEAYQKLGVGFYFINNIGMYKFI